MDPSKVYTVLFDEGSAGTFLIWFVSRHQDFFKLKTEYTNQYGNPDKNTSWTFQGSARHLIIIEINSYKFSKQSLDQYVIKNFYKAAPDNKIIFKMLPHSYNAAIKVQDCFPKINVIMLIAENYNWINSRLESFHQKSNVFMEARFEISKQQQQNWREYFKINDVNYCTITIDKILNLDTAEYQKLLEFIDSPPIVTWQDIVRDYKKNAGIPEVW